MIDYFDLPMFANDDDYTADLLGYSYLNCGQMASLSLDIARRTCNTLNRFLRTCERNVEDAVSRDNWSISTRKEMIGDYIASYQMRCIGLAEFLYYDLMVIDNENYVFLLDTIENTYAELADNAITGMRKKEVK